MGRTGAEDGVDIKDLRFDLLWLLLLNGFNELRLGSGLLEEIVLLVDGSFTLVNKHTLITLEGNGLEDTVSLIVPLLFENLNVLASTLLNLDVRVVLVSLDNVLDSLAGTLESDSELGQCSESPADYNIAPFPFAIVLVQNVLVHIQDLLLWNCNWRAVGILSRSVDEHFTELAHEPAAQLHEPHLINVVFHSEKDF